MIYVLAFNIPWYMLKQHIVCGIKIIYFNIMTTDTILHNYCEHALVCCGLVFQVVPYDLRMMRCVSGILHVTTGFGSYSRTLYYTDKLFLSYFSLSCHVWRCSYHLHSKIHDNSGDISCNNCVIQLVWYGIYSEHQHMTRSDCVIQRQQDNTFCRFLISSCIQFICDLRCIVFPF